MALLFLLVKLVSANCQQVLMAWERTELCTVSVQLKLALVTQHSHAKGDTPLQRSEKFAAGPCTFMRVDYGFYGTQSTVSATLFLGILYA